MDNLIVSAGFIPEKVEVQSRMLPNLVRPAVILAQVVFDAPVECGTWL